MLPAGERVQYANGSARLYAVDAAGNRLGERGNLTDGGAVAGQVSTDRAGRIAQLTLGTVTRNFQWDAAGRLVRGSTVNAAAID